jgi:general stress protein 26
MSKQSSVDRIWDIIENVGVCMLATQRAGRLRARPMEPRRDRKHRLIFAVTDSHSAKLDEIEATSDIGLIFIDAKAKAYLSITGRACVTRDISKMKEIWRATATRRESTYYSCSHSRWPMRQLNHLLR